MKKLWKRPKLTVIIRAEDGEHVLSQCKTKSIQGENYFYPGCTAQYWDDEANNGDGAMKCGGLCSSLS